MKYNLKTLKDQNKAILEEEPDSSIDPRFMEWLDGFERGLRELGERKNLNLEMSAKSVIREILGE